MTKGNDQNTDKELYELGTAFRHLQGLLRTLNSWQAMKTKNLENEVFLLKRLREKLKERLVSAKGEEFERLSRQLEDAEKEIDKIEISLEELYMIEEVF